MVIRRKTFEKSCWFPWQPAKFRFKKPNDDQMIKFKTGFYSQIEKNRAKPDHLVKFKSSNHGNQNKNVQEIKLVSLTTRKILIGKTKL